MGNSFVIFSWLSNGQFCLDVDAYNNVIINAYAQAGPATWDFYLVPGSLNYGYLRHSRVGVWANLGVGNGNQVVAGPLIPNDQCFVVRVDTAGPGMLALNRFDGEQVLDVQASGGAGTPVLLWTYQGNTNQQWAMVRADNLGP